MRSLFVTILSLSILSAIGQTAPPDEKTPIRLKLVAAKLSPDLPNLIEIYKDLHRHPELSQQEERSAAKMAQELKALGFEVTEKVGGTGVVGLFKNGPGPLILVRADMDALPIVEQTGLDYASKVTTRDKTGREVGVMHACGHDIHMTCFVGTARVLTSLKDQWSGTLMFVAQPAEEVGAGARAMLADGLYKRFGKPDYCLALHSDAQLEVGHINYSEGLAMANVDTVEILVKGRGGHGSAPHNTIDPIVLASKLVLDLQTIVSREVPPIEPAVVTVGSIHGGTKANIIPNDVKLQITVRSTKDSVRKTILDAIKRKAKAAADSAKAPEPEVTHMESEFTPKLENNVPLTRQTVDLFKQILGDDKLHIRPPIMGGEDFSRYALNGEIPIFMYFLGTVDPDKVAASKKEGAKPLPGIHTDGYTPVPEPSIRHGVTTMSMAVLNLIGKK